MASVRKESKKSHNPAESVCRKIRAIRKREALLNPIRQIAKCKSSSPDSPRSKTKRAFGEMLARVTATHVPVLDSHFSSSERRHSLASRPETLSSRTSPSSPQDGLDLVGLEGSENCSQQRPWSHQHPPSLESQSGQGGCFPSKDLGGSCSTNSLYTSDLGFLCSSERDTMFSTPWDQVVRKLSLNEDGK